MFIMLHFRISAVSGTIHFHDQLAVTAGEVGDIRANGKLPDKFETPEPAIADRFPEPALSFGVIFSQGASAFQRLRILIGRGAIKARDPRMVKRPSSGLRPPSPMPRGTGEGDSLKRFCLLPPEVLSLRKPPEAGVGPLIPPGPHRLTRRFRYTCLLSRSRWKARAPSRAWIHRGVCRA